MINGHAHVNREQHATHIFSHTYTFKTCIYTIYTYIITYIITYHHKSICIHNLYIGGLKRWSGQEMAGCSCCTTLGCPSWCLMWHWCAKDPAYGSVDGASRKDQNFSSFTPGKRCSDLRVTSSIGYTRTKPWHTTSVCNREKILHSNL